MCFLAWPWVNAHGAREAQIEHDSWIRAASYRVASILQKFFRLPNGASHGRTGHGEEIGFVVAYAEGLCAGIHLRSKEKLQLEGFQLCREPAVHPCCRPGKQHSPHQHAMWQAGMSHRATRSHQRYEPKEQQLYSQHFSPSLGSFTSSLKGRGGTVLSRLNMSSHRSARMHSARLSTSLAIGPTAATTGGDQESVIMVEGRLWLTWSTSCMKAGPLSIALT